VRLVLTLGVPPAFCAFGLRHINAVVTVGDGRGFFVEGQEGWRVVTAAHCLPHLPEPFPKKGEYPALLAPRSELPMIASACVFVGPISDIAGAWSARLRSPDYDRLRLASDGLATAPPRNAEAGAAGRDPGAPCWLLSISGEWFSCLVRCIREGSLWLHDLASPIEPGMCSPILDGNGAAIGVMSVSNNGDLDDGPNPCLIRNLPSGCSRT
jgi:hypothetical protein